MTSLKPINPRPDHSLGVGFALIAPRSALSATALRAKRVPANLDPSRLNRKFPMIILFFAS